MKLIQTGGFSCANVFDDDVPDEAPTEDADAFPIDEVIDCNDSKFNRNVSEINTYSIAYGPYFEINSINSRTKTKNYHYCDSTRSQLYPQ